MVEEERERQLLLRHLRLAHVDREMMKKMSEVREIGSAPNGMCVSSGKRKKRKRKCDCCVKWMWSVWKWCVDRVRAAMRT